jgi:hypothetical protein
MMACRCADVADIPLMTAVSNSRVPSDLQDRTAACMGEKGALSDWLWLYLWVWHA